MSQAIDITNDDSYNLPTTITDGFKHHYSVGDEIKWFPNEAWVPYYGDVVSINKKTISIKYQTYGNSTKTARVDPRELNFD